MPRVLLLTSAILAAGFLAACEADDSAPTHPRQPGFLTPNDKAQQNAEQRNLEKPARDLPTKASDLPGQSAAPAYQTVLTLDNAPPTPAPPAPTASTFNVLGYAGPTGWQAFGHTTEPARTYTRDRYPQPIPHLPLNPGTVPIPGATPMPGGDFLVDHAWGQGLTLPEYPHRDWPATTALYETPHATHNPLFFTNVQEQLPVPQNDGTYRANVKSAFIEIPWFYVNSAVLPLLMVLECPMAKRHTDVITPDPIYNGYLPAGPIVPAPTTGALRWEYPFLNSDGTIKQTNGNTAPTTVPSPPPSAPQ